MHSNPDLTRSGAVALDRSDRLSPVRDRFLYPTGPDGRPVVYLAGNSLGLQLKSVREASNQRLTEWAEDAVNAWHQTDWMLVENRLAESSARIVGALPSEVAVAGTLTGNLHALMASFYRPAGGRRIILMEHNPFPSDRYAAGSQARWHGLDPDDTVIVAPSGRGDAALLEIIERSGPEIALVLLAGVNYYDGKAYDIESITRVARARGVTVGLDLAHAAGNIPLALHDWNVDFAAWCGYKYLNGGPGAPAGLFVHERHHGAPRLSGWWGHEPATRFAMPPGFVPASGAAGWKMSTPAILGLAPLQESLALFDEIGMESITAKSRQLTGFLEQLILKHLAGRLRVTTPARRGAQLSLSTEGGPAVFRRLSRAGVVCDWREPATIRVAPAPLYNTFSEMVTFVDRLEQALTD
jgi:kynureninase